METIHIGYWKISSRAAISSSNAESNLGRISLNVVEKKGMRIALLIARVGLRNPSGVDQASNWHPSHNVRIIAASQFNQHEQETPDV
jgi:hypothetical protein